MIPMECFALEHAHSNNGENGQRNNFLNNFQLEKRKRSAIANKADSVARHLKAIFKESQAPGEKYHTYQWPTVGNLHLAEFQMSVPRKRHEDV